MTAFDSSEGGDPSWTKHQRMVYGILKHRPGEGVAVETIQSKLDGKISPAEIREIVGFFQAEGHVYEDNDGKLQLCD